MNFTDIEKKKVVEMVSCYKDSNNRNNENSVRCKYRWHFNSTKWYDLGPISFNLEDSSLDLNEYPEMNLLRLFRTSIDKIIIPNNNEIKNISLHKNDKLESLNFENLNSVKKISIGNNQKLNFDVNKIIHFSNLENLSLSLVNFNSRISLSTFNNLNNLQDLSLENFNFYSPLSIFSNLNNLRRLSLNDSNIHGTLLSLMNLNNLRVLGIYNTNIIPSFEYLFTNLKLVNFFKPVDSIDKGHLINKFFVLFDSPSFGSDFLKDHPLLIENSKDIDLIVTEEEELFKKLEDNLIFIKLLYHNRELLHKRINIKTNLREINQNDHRFLIIIENCLLPWLKTCSSIEKKSNNNKLQKSFTFSLNYYFNLLDNLELNENNKINILQESIEVV